MRLTFFRSSQAMLCRGGPLSLYLFYGRDLNIHSFRLSLVARDLFFLLRIKFQFQPKKYFFSLNIEPEIQLIKENRTLLEISNVAHKYSRN